MIDDFTVMCIEIKNMEQLISLAVDDALGSTHHLVTEHLMVGDFKGLMRGSVDYFTN